MITIKCLHNIYLTAVILLIAQVYKKKTMQCIHLHFNYLNYYYFYFDFLFLEFPYGDLSSGNFTRPMNAACFYNVSETEQFCKQQQAYKQYKISRTRYWSKLFTSKLTHVQAVKRTRNVTILQVQHDEFIMSFLYGFAICATL